MAHRPNDTMLYSAFRNFLDNCIVKNNSLLWPDKEAWTRERVIEIKERMVDSPIWGGELSFDEKLKEQMKGSTPEHWAIICDTFYVYFLPSSFMKIHKKMGDIRKATEQGGLVPPPENSEIWDALKSGFTRTGQRYHLKYAQFWFILLFAYNAKGSENVPDIINSSKQMQELLDRTLESVPKRTDRAYDMRHAMLYLTFPDQYERMISTRDKERVIENYRKNISGELPADIDQAILKIRQALSPKYDKPDRQFDFYQELKDEWKPGKSLPKNAIKVSKGIGLVTVPEKEDLPDETIAIPTEVSAHTKIQYILLKLGSDMGLDVWIAKNDRSKEIEGEKLSHIPRILAALPTQFDEATMKTIELIDVLWLKGKAIVAAFEIESTTSIYSGLLRMSDLISMQPNLNISLYIVAPDERSSKVMFEVNRPTFSRLEPPLSELCSYISFSSIEEAIEKHGSVFRYMKPDILEKISESCVIDE